MSLVVGTGLKPFDNEIVEFLLEKRKVRFTELRDQLMETLEWKNKGSLDVRLSRRLDALEVAGYIERERKSHKRVYYSLTKRTRIQLELENSELEELVQEVNPSLRMYVENLENQPLTSILKVYLRVTPLIIFEILTLCYKERFPEEAELKRITPLLVGTVAKIFASMHKELKEKFEQGEDLQKIFEQVERWVNQKFAEEKQLQCNLPIALPVTRSEPKNT